MNKMDDYVDNPIKARRETFKHVIVGKKYDALVKKSISLKRQISILDEEMDRIMGNKTDVVERKYLENELGGAREQYG